MKQPDHTGALAGSADVQDGLWRETELLLARDLEELLALTELCSRAQVPAGPRLGISRFLAARG